MIKIEVKDQIAELVLSVNKANALDISYAMSLTNLVERTGRRKDIKAIILTNSGDSFCTGADIEEISRHPDLAGESKRAWSCLIAAVYDCEVPVIAAVDGHLSGGGVALAASCDIILLSERTVIDLPGKSLNAMDLQGSDGIEAVLPSGQLLGAARALASEMAQNSGGAPRMGKVAINGTETLDLRHDARFEHDFMAKLFAVPKQQNTFNRML